MISLYYQIKKGAPRGADGYNMKYFNFINVYELGQRLKDEGLTAKEAAETILQQFNAVKSKGVIYHGCYFNDSPESDIINIIGDVYFN